MAMRCDRICEWAKQPGATQATQASYVELMPFRCNTKIHEERKEESRRAGERCRVRRRVGGRGQEAESR